MSSRRKKKRKSSRKPVQRPPRRQFSIIWLSLIAVAIVGTAVLVMVNLRSTGPNRSAKPDTTAPIAQSTESPDKSGRFENLIGRWLRPDGGYIIEIRNISTDGRMDAAYLNPRSIHVARAQASWKKGKQEVFIELQDTGYPGSTYTLDYMPDQDMLVGIYFQAAMNQVFEVVFIRKK